MGLAAFLTRRYRLFAYGIIYRWSSSTSAPSHCTTSPQLLLALKETPILQVHVLIALHLFKFAASKSKEALCGG